VNIDLLEGFYLGVEAAAQTYVFKQRRAGSEEGEVGPAVAMRLRVGVGMSL
jgi:hypothetical protein